MAPKEDLLSSSAELVYGQPLRVPGDFLAISFLVSPEGAACLAGQSWNLSADPDQASWSPVGACSPGSVDGKICI